MNPSAVLFLELFIPLELAVAAMALCAKKERLLTPAHIRARGERYGLPLYGHGGWWGDLLLMSGVAAALVAAYGSRWSLADWALAAVPMTLVNAAMHYLWSKNPMLDCLASRGRLSLAGKVHWVYMEVALTIVGMFYFRTSGVDPAVYLAVSFAIVVHELAANHKFLDLFRPWWWPYDPKARIQGWAVIAVIVVLLYWRRDHVIS